MKHIRNVLLSGTILMVLFTSCDTPRYAYSPSAHNVPLLSKQGDSKIAANYSTNADISSDNNNNKYSRNRSNGYDLQGAVAVTDHIGLQGSYFSRTERNSYADAYNGDSSVVRYKRNLAEFGAGYFTSINRRNKIFFQAFAGVGFGKLNLTDAARDFNGVQYNRFYNSDIRKYYIEPAIIFRNKEVFAASISTRLSVISFRNIRTDYTQDEKQNYKLDSLDRYSSVFFEPAFVNSYGFNKLPGFRIEYQLGLCLALDSNADGGILDYRPFNFSIGLVFDIGKLIRGQANKSKD